MSDKHGKAIAVVEASPVATMHPLVEAAVQQGLDPSQLGELLKVQRAWEAGEAKKAYDAAMVQLKEQLPSIIYHDQVVDFESKKTHTRTNYTHTSLAKVVAEVVPHLTGCGFVHSWKAATDRDGISVTCLLRHRGGHAEEHTISSPPDTSGNKGPAQARMSTITMLQRYSLLSLLGIATADMREPHGPQPDSDQVVNAARNLKAAAALGKYGKTRAEAEQFLEKDVCDWTGSDIEDLKKWVRKDDTNDQE